MVAKRGASKPFAELDFTGLAYGRVLDDMSTASLTAAADSQCCGILGDLREWAHELWIYRNDERVWKGPVTPQASYSEAAVTVPAKDMFAWFERRFADDQARGAHSSSFSRLIVYRDADVNSIFIGILDRARRRDPHPPLIVETAPSGIILPEFHVDPFQRPRAADVLRSLAHFGADFTFIDDRVLVGAPEVTTTALTYLTSSVVSGVTVTPLPTASEVTIIGSNAGTAGDPFTSTVGAGGLTTTPYGSTFWPIDPVIGLVVEVDNASDLTSQLAVNIAAQTRLDFYRGDPLLASFTLDPQAPVDFDRLIPGAKVRLDIDSTCRTLSGVYRLTKVDVTVAVSDTDVSETVRCEVAPLGSVRA